MKIIEWHEVGFRFARLNALTFLVSDLRAPRKSTFPLTNFHHFLKCETEYNENGDVVGKFMR